MTLASTQHLQDRSPKRAARRYTLIVAVPAVALTVVAILFVNPYSLLLYAYYFVLWNAFIFVFHKKELKDFSFAFIINSFFIGIFFSIQTYVFPTSYGTTSPLGSWTDDSYFFTLVANSVPPGLVTRANYYEYTHPFSTIIRYLTPLPINHPMDVIFFQSGTAAVISVFTKKFVIQMSGDIKAAKLAYLLTLVCPFLMMNGGVIFLRDTLAAALLIYSMACINDRRFALAIGAIGIQFLIRPGTAFILLPAYGIIYFIRSKMLSRGNLIALALFAPLLIIGAIRALISVQDIPEYAAYFETMGMGGREVYSDLQATDGANGIFLRIQEFPFVVKFVLNGIYMFVYPFLDVRTALNQPYFDVRTILMTVVAPIYGIWLNAGFIAGFMTKVRAMRAQKQIGWAVVITLFLIGTYSLQTRHKTLIYPLYYVIVALGLTRAKPSDLRMGFLGSTLIVAFELAAYIF
jgi:hypothetical protein